MEKVSSQKVQNNMSEILNGVAYSHKRYKISRRNKDMAIIISIDEWEAIEKILKNLEDQDDMREAVSALKEIQEKGSVPFDEMKKRLGL